VSNLISIPFSGAVNIQRVLRLYVVTAIVIAPTLLIATACRGPAETIDVESVPGPPYTSTVIIGGGGNEDGLPLQVEVADTPEERSRGLMNRESLPEGAGMLFTWPEDSSSGFWMKDTLIPLSVAFIDADGRIIDIQDMEPRDETLHYSPQPFRFAVEVNRGWFGEHAIEAGDTMTLPEDGG
jgi:uncharacterized membrane protein (UPF0127 family)